MTKFFLLLLLMCAGSFLIAQDTLSLVEVDSPPTLNYENVDGTAATDSPEKLLLTAVYGNIGYPRAARESGMMTVVSAQWLINTRGELVVEDVHVLSKEEALGTTQSKENFIITAFTPGRISQGKSMYRLDGPDLTKREKRQQRKLNIFVVEVRSVLGKLPDFQPGTRAGTPVATRYERMFIFRIE